MFVSGTPELELGDLDLIDPSPAAGAAFYFQALGEGSTLGNPIPVRRSLDTLLTDGAKVVTESHDNREPAFQVQIVAPDAAALADGEKALFLELARTDLTLTYRHPDGIGERTVYEVVTASMDHEYDDINELRLIRTYSLRLICAPFGRSEFETVVEALTAGAGTEATISDGSSATGWSSPYGSVAVVSGALRAPSTAFSSVVNMGGYYVKTTVAEATLSTAAINFSTTPYLSFDYEGVAHAGSTAPVLSAVYADGAALTVVADKFIDASTRRATVFTLDASVTTLRLVWSVTHTTLVAGSAATSLADVLFDDVKRGPRSPASSTSGKESLRSIEVGGSARTQASLQVAHATSGLGDVIVYTAPTVGRGYDPSLRQFYSAAVATVADTDAIVGSRVSLDTALTFDVPTSALPRGGYVLYARIKADSTSTVKFNWSAATRIGTTDLAPAQSGQTPSLSLTTTYRIVPIATLVLPPTEVSVSSAAVVRVTLEQDTANTCDLDQLWLFYRGEGSALSIVSAGSGTPALGAVHNRLWLDSATLARTEPSLWVGTLEGQVDALHGGGFAGEWEVPSFPPGDLGFYVATTGVADAAVSGRMFKRWHSHAAEAS